MNKETLKALIEVEFERAETISQFKAEVYRLIDLYDNDRPAQSFPFGIPNMSVEEDLVPYGELCSCNPKNGGSGLCGCVMGNKLVPRQNTGGNGGWVTTTTLTNFNDEQPG